MSVGLRHQAGVMADSRHLIACSLGAALGPLLTSYLSQTQGSFNSVFYMLYASSLAAAVLLSRLVINEVPLSRHPTLNPSQLNQSKSVRTATSLKLPKADIRCCAMEPG